MFIELNKDGYFLGFFENREDILSENQGTIIEVNDALHSELKTKKPWRIIEFDTNKIYGINDQYLFVEIVDVPQPNENELLSKRLEATEQMLLQIMMEGMM